MERIPDAVGQVQELITRQSIGSKDQLNQHRNPTEDKQELEKEQELEEDQEQKPEDVELQSVLQLTELIDDINASLTVTRTNVVKMKETVKNAEQLLNLWQRILMHNSTQERSLGGPGGLEKVDFQELGLSAEEAEECAGLESDYEVVELLRTKKKIKTEINDKQEQYERLTKEYNELIKR